MGTAALCCAAALLVLPSRSGDLRRIRRREQSPDNRRHTVERPDPLAVATTFDLLAACLRSGLPIAAAAAAVADAAPEVFAGALRTAAGLLELGAEPDVAWAAVAQDPATDALASMARRSARSGSSMADAMSELAAAQRTTAEDASAAKAERAGVLISGPLGLCFLPAFVCLGIVPVVIGLAGNVLGAGLL